LVGTDYAAPLAGAQQKISSYLLLCSGLPYVANGEPVYVGDDVVGLGPDRKALIDRDWTNYQARSLDPNLWMLSSGDFQRADERQSDKIFDRRLAYGRWSYILHQRPD
jgi:hypothetical protein